MLHVPFGEMTVAEQVCYDAGWATPLEAYTLREELFAASWARMVFLACLDPSTVQTYKNLAHAVIGMAEQTSCIQKERG